jgi:transposase
MARAYSDDLRMRLLEAYESGAGSLRKLALQFRVSWGYAKKIRAQQRRTGQKQRQVQQRRGPISRMDATVQARLRDWLREQPDLTEAELRDRLAGAGVSVSKSRVGQVLRQMGERRKKNAARGRAGYRVQPQTARRVPPNRSGHRAGEADFPG